MVTMEVQNVSKLRSAKVPRLESVQLHHLLMDEITSLESSNQFEFERGE